MRQADADLFEGLLGGEFCYVLNTRQIGKSSLMVRTAQRLREEGLLVALLDLTAIGQNVTVEEWYDGLLTLLAEQLRMRQELEEFWEEHAHLGPMQRFMEALRRVVLESRTESICLFVDEIDSVRSLPFATDELFAGIRECYNRRVQDSTFNRLTFCLLGVATPVDLISDPRISPFNIGKRILLTDFTLHEASVLTFGLGKERDGKPILERVLHWTRGHPYLTQRLCSALAARHAPLSPRQVDAVCRELFLNKQAQETDDNLAFVRNRLLQDGPERTAALDVYRQILEGRKISDDATNPVHTAIRLSGIASVRDGILTVRNRIYARVFDARWVLANMPDAEVRRQRSAYRRGVVRSAGVFGGLAAVIAALLVFAIISANRARSLDARASRLLYIADMNLVQREWEAGNTAHFQDLLNEMRNSPDRGFEWDYWNMLGHRSIQSFSAQSPTGENEAWGAIAFSPDGRTVAGLGVYGVVAEWSIANGVRKTIANSGASYGSAITYSPDGKTLLLIAGNCVQIRDAANGALLCSLIGHTKPVRDMICSKIGGRVITRSDDGTVRVWSLSNGRCERVLREPGVPIVYLAAAESRFVTCTNRGLVRVWDMRSLNAKCVLHTEFGTDVDQPTKSHIALSHDGSKLLGNAGGNTLELMETDTGRVLLRISAEREIAAIRFSMDDSMFIVADKLGVHVRDASTGSELDEFHEHRAEITSAEYSGDGRYLADSSLDGTIKLWDLRRGLNPVNLKASAESLWTLRYSYSGARAAVGSSDGCAYVFDTRDGRCVLTLKGAGRQNVAVFSHNGNRIAVAGASGTITVWDARTGSKVSTFSPHTAAINAMAYAPDDRRLVTGSDDHNAKVVDAETGKVMLTFSEHRLAVEAVDISPDGRHVATGADDSTVKIWDISSGRLIRTLQSPAEVWGVAFSPDGARLVNGNLANTAQIWEVSTGRLLSTLSGHTRRVTGVAFSSDGRRVITGSSDRTARIWESATGRELLALRGHMGQLNGVGFSLDGSQVATSSADGHVRLWNAASDLPFNH
jgi:WD40 repeat protein